MPFLPKPVRQPFAGERNAEGEDKKFEDIYLVYVE